MRKFLLGSMIFATIGMMAQTEANPPQSGFFLSGLNGETTATTNNTLTYVPGDEDDIDEGIYRYRNDNVEINGECTFIIDGSEGMKIGYDPDNFMGMENILSDKSSSLYLTENGEAINCELSAGNYSVILASMLMTDDNDVDYLSWMIQFTNNNTEEATIAYYIVGLNGEIEAAQSNRFITQIIEGEPGEEDSMMFTYPKFYVGEDAGSYTIVSSNGDVYGGAEGAITDDAAPFAMLTENGTPIKCELEEGFYTVNFIPMGFMNMVSFIRCEDQTPADECIYYLTGFGDDIEFTRNVETSSYEDEDGEIKEDTSITYTIDKVHLSSCPEGFLVVSQEGQDFYFGLNDAMAAFLGDTVTNDNGMAMVGIYGSPIFWDMEENDYTVTFFTSGAMGGYIAFEVYEEAGVDSIGEDTNETPVYYDLQGRRINNPDKGIFIKKVGNKVIKIVK